MSPQSMLHTPVELLRHAPHEGSQASHGERRERRAALGVVIGMVALVGLGVLLGSRHGTPAQCADQAAATAPAECPAR